MDWRRLVAPFIEVQFLRYAISAVGAMAVDVGCFVIFLGQGLAAGPAAAIAYAAGMVVNWWLVSRGVFEMGLAPRGNARTRQLMLFFGTTLAGLALTTATVSVLTAAGVLALVAKAVAIAISFFLNWAVRKYFVFRTAQL